MSKYKRIKKGTKTRFGTLMRMANKEGANGWKLIAIATHKDGKNKIYHFKQTK